MNSKVTLGLDLTLDFSSFYEFTPGDRVWEIVHVKGKVHFWGWGHEQCYVVAPVDRRLATGE